MGKTFFISDLHFGHKNILTYDGRPFSSIEEHDQALISRWNSVVTDDDDVWILGDVSWYNPRKTFETITQLNGRKHLCKGNHDVGILSEKKLRDCFVEICHYKELPLDGRRCLVLSHYPISCFNGQRAGWCHLYGHVHNSHDWDLVENFRREMENFIKTPCNMYNVGCMMPYMDYAPRTLEEIVALCAPPSEIVH